MNLANLAPRLLVIFAAAGLIVPAAILTAHPDDQESGATQQASPADSSSSRDNESEGEVTYVGREVCAECHRENYDLHANHGHASTFFKIPETDLPDRYAGQSIDAGEDFGVYQYRKDDDGSLFAQLPELDELPEVPLEYALGSGHNAQTLLTLRAADDGGTIGLEHRITCYRGGELLALTVGHVNKTADSPIQRYGDKIQGETLERCIYCHTTTADVGGGRIENLVAHINCEKCHGPGSEHVRLARQSTTPPPYSVGQSDWDTESENQLCGDCHRLPRSLNKAELREYPDTLARFQPVGLLMSECYLKSGRQLRCSTCHNPHRSVHGVAKSEHVEQCVACHDEADDTHTICPVNATTGCIECHMPAIDQSQGIKFHDHWIRVREHSAERR